MSLALAFLIHQMYLGRMPVPLGSWWHRGYDLQDGSVTFCGFIAQSPLDITFFSGAKGALTLKPLTGPFPQGPDPFAASHAHLMPPKP